MAKDSGAINLFGGMQKPTKEKSEKVVKNIINEVEPTVVPSVKKVKNDEESKVEIIEELSTQPLEIKTEKTAIENTEQVSSSTINKPALGRPKKYESNRCKFTVYTSEKIMSFIDMATKCTFSDSRSDYILKLVEEDIKRNKERYEEFYKYRK